MPKGEAYREQQAGLRRKESAERREIGPVPLIADWERRELCRDDLELFCKTYNPVAFHRPWGEGQVHSVRRIQAVAMRGGLHAFAEARGSGKTARCRMAALWATAYGHRRYAFLIGSTAERGRESLDTLKTWIRFLPLFVADFPEIVHPAIKIAGIAQRGGGQTSDGVPTLIKWHEDQVVLPTIAPPANWPAHWPLREDGMVPTSGTVIGASGLTGEGIRGSLFALPTGELLRPDFVLLDDPQTPESARSLKQNRDRLSLANGDLLGLAGPGEQMACVMPCTVIEPGDFADMLLDRTKNPLWRGERSGILTAMPKNLDAWEKYFEVYHEDSQKDPPDLVASNAYFLKHEAELSEGTAATWPDRKFDEEASPVQHAMHFYVRDRAVFMAEYMNQPVRGDEGGEIKALVAAEVSARVSGSPRYTLPPACSLVTAFFDPGAILHWYCVVGWSDSFGGSVLDYGCWPRQTRVVFDSHDAGRKLRDEYPGYTDAQLVRQGLDALTAEVLGRSYPSAGGSEVRIARALVDSGHERDAVYDFCRASPHAGILMPSKGIGRSSTAKGVGAWQARPGERRGHHWRVTAADTGRGQQVQFDTDVWKTIVYERFALPLGGRSTLTLYGTPERAASRHETYGLHLAAEYGRKAMSHGVEFYKWVVRPNAVDNHWLDCTSGCAVAASVAGLVLASTADGRPLPKKPPGPVLSAADAQARRLGPVNAGKGRRLEFA